MDINKIHEEPVVFKKGKDEVRQSGKQTRFRTKVVGGSTSSSPIKKVKVKGSTVASKMKAARKADRALRNSTPRAKGEAKDKD